MDEMELHKVLKGKIRVNHAIEVTQETLKLLYTPGVANVALECAKDPLKTFEYTRRRKLIAVVSDGSAVLGLGNIGPYGALPVMEGKAMLFKQFGDLDAVPICLKTQDTDEIVKIVSSLEPNFGGVNLEDISAPRCFEILRTLNETLEIPVFHDDQQGTAVVVVAGLINALKLAEKRIEDVKIVVNGIGAAGYNIVKLLFEFGARNIIPCDVHGIINENNALHEYHLEIAKLCGTLDRSGSLRDALDQADVFIGVSKGNLLVAEDIKRMNKAPVVFALANPVPEIDPAKAYEAGAFIVATGRSDYPNQINNLLAFPGIMRFAVEKQVKINNRVLRVAAEVLASAVDPKPDEILPKPFERWPHEYLYHELSKRFSVFAY
ncbi:NAD(P)-dependent malic enzyme [Fervidobacterium thailandense]|uniref:Malate dehydrogenase n=1 Tax=Fervidobacterium thailandense TaxID=1008305 RepID=A0A1E3G440_9BACT|nr:NADP-dependent malic enzyme [Fervidobacterium thailandense]ODN30458.1 malate dehydrogenase [Fervidobacterium thailandense]